jgi:Rad3-related DNA helicase
MKGRAAYRRNARALRALATAGASVRRTMISNADKDLIETLVHAARDIINGRIKLKRNQLSALRRCEHSLHDFLTAKDLKTRKRTLQSGGFLGLLLKPLLGLLTGALFGGGQR